MSETWTVKSILEWIEGFLAEHGDENPRLSAQWLVSDALGMSRIQLYADFARPLTLEERDLLRDYTRRRAAGEPLQYITGTTDFRFITVDVEPGVLIPRPETEVLVSEALAELRAMFRKAEDAEAASAPETARETELKTESEADPEPASEPALTPEPEPEPEPQPEPEPEPMRVIDLCTGTGCIACSIATEEPRAQVIATDIEPKAVDLAGRNARKLGVDNRVQVLECNLGDGVPADEMGTFHLVVSNPPYIPSAVMDTLEPQVAGFEPALALDGGADGLDLFRKIVPFAQAALTEDGVLAVELHETCLDQAAVLAREGGFAHTAIVNDLAGRPRVLIARKG